MKIGYSELQENVYKIIEEKNGLEKKDFYKNNKIKELYIYEENMKKYKDELEKFNEILIENNFQDIEELREFIKKYKNHNCNFVNLKNSKKEYKEKIDKDKYKLEYDSKDDLKTRFPIIIYEKTNNKCKQYAAGEFCNKIKYTHELKNKIDDEKNKNTFDDVANYIHSNERKLEINNSNEKDLNKKSVKQNKYKLKK